MATLRKKVNEDDPSRVFKQAQTPKLMDSAKSNNIQAHSLLGLTEQLLSVLFGEESGEPAAQIPPAQCLSSFEHDTALALQGAVTNLNAIKSRLTE